MGISPPSEGLLILSRDPEQFPLVNDMEFAARFREKEKERESMSLVDPNDPADFQQKSREYMAAQCYHAVRREYETSTTDVVDVPASGPRYQDMTPEDLDNLVIGKYVPKLVDQPVASVATEELLTTTDPTPNRVDVLEEEQLTSKVDTHPNGRVHMTLLRLWRRIWG